MITWPQAFFYSVCVLAVAIIVGSLSPVIAQQARSGGYMVASDGRAFVWRVNTSTGALSYCIRRTDSLDAGALRNTTPFCSAEVAGPQN